VTRLQRRSFLAAYLSSGFAGLLYQVVWSRLLTLSMGHNVAAVGTVLAAFMGGLATGAALGGRLATRLERGAALRGYAYLELLIGAAALSVAPILGLATPLLHLAYGDAGGPWFAVVRLGVSLSLIAIPAALMGATLPFSVKWYARDAAHAGPDAGALYAMNTVGAAAGAAVTGFLLIPALGLRTTSACGAALNVAAALTALWIARRSTDALARTDKTVAPAAPAGEVRQGRAPKRAASTRSPAAAVSSAGISIPIWVPAVLVGVSGFVALVYEVTWTRLLGLVLGPTTWAFSSMLCAFIVGIAAGAGAAARALSRTSRTGFWLGVVLIAMALASLGAALALGQIPLVVAAAAARADADLARMVPLQIGVALALLVPMSMASGAAFPLAVAMATRRDREVPRDVANVYAANTAGAVGGALAASFLLVPALGAEGTIRASAVAVTIAGSLLAIRVDRAGRRALAAGLAAGTILAAALLPRWDRALLSSGAYKYAPYLAQADLETALEAGTLHYYGEGAAGIVTVREVTGTLALAIDGKVDASNGGDMLTQKLLAHLPLLLHESPRRVAIIGLGSGVTLGAALVHPIERADAIEISPEVVAASAFFSRENRGALADPRSRLIVGDGRSHLFLTGETYDVIVSEPSNPWMAGIASLFTREFFAAARARLASDGILCQWAHTYDISEADLRSIAATFRAVFPEATLWLVGEGDLLLIGSTQPLVPRLRGLSAHLDRPGVAADLHEIDVRDEFSLFSMFAGGPRALERFARGALVQTDDRTLLEFSAPRAIYGRARPDNAAIIRRLVSGPAELPQLVRDGIERAGAAEWRNRGLMLLRAEAYRDAYDDLARAVRLDAGDPEALTGLERAAGRAGRLQDALALVRDIAAGRSGNVAVRIALARLLAATGDAAQALDAARQATGLDPSNLSAQEQLASVVADAGDADALRAVVRTLQSLAPDRASTYYYDATLRFLTGDLAGAAEIGERAIQLEPADARAENLVGAAHANLGNGERARAAFEAAVRADPEDPTSRVNLGRFELGAGKARQAASHFAQALLIDPRSPAALAGMADAMAALGRPDRAAALRGRIR
jgi:spermidine synthase